MPQSQKESFEQLRRIITFLTVTVRHFEESVPYLVLSSKRFRNGRFQEYDGFLASVALDTWRLAIDGALPDLKIILADLEAHQKAERLPPHEMLKALFAALGSVLYAAKLSQVQSQRVWRWHKDFAAVAHANEPLKNLSRSGEYLKDLMENLGALGEVTKQRLRE